MNKKTKTIIATAFRAIAYIIGALLAIALLAVLVMETSWFKKNIRSILVREANKNIAGELTVGRLSGDLLTGIVFDNILLTAQNGELLAMERLEVHFRLLPLLYRTVHIRSLTFISPHFTLKRGNEGVWNIVALFQGSTRNIVQNPVSSSPWTVSVRHFRIRQGCASVDPGTTGHKVIITGLQMDAGGSFTTGKKIDVQLNIHDLALEIPEKKIALRHLSTRARWDGKKGTLQSFELKTASSTVTARGFFQAGAEPRLNASIKFSAGAEELTTITGHHFPAGTVNGTVSAQGTIRSLAFEQRLNWRDMNVDSKGTLDAVLPSIVMKVRATNVHPSLLAGLAPDNNADVINADADIMVRGKKPSTMDASITLSAYNSQLIKTTMDRAVFYGVLHQGILVSTLSVHMPAGSIAAAASGTIAGLWDRESIVDVNASANIFRLNLSALAGNATDFALNASITAHAGKEAGNHTAFAIETVVDIDSSSIKGIALYPSRIAGEYRASTVVIKEAKISSELGQLRLDGQADIPGNISTHYDMQLEQMERLSKLFPKVPLSGSASFNGLISGSIQHPAVTLNLVGKNIGISSATFSELSLQASVKDVRHPESGPASLAIRTTGIAYGHSKIREVVFDAQRSSVTAIVNLKTTLDNSRGVLVSGSVTSNKWALKAIHLARFEIHNGTASWRNNLPADAQVTARGWEMTPFEFSSAGEQRIVAFGSTRDNVLEYTVRLDSVNISGAGAIAGINIPLEGVLQGSVTLSGTTSSPIVAGRLTLDNESIERYPFSRLAIAVSYRDELVQALITLNNKGETLLTADGNIPVRLSFAPLRAVVLSSGLDVRVKTARLSPSMFTSFIHGVEKADGDIRADLSLNGDPHDPSISGQISVDSGTLTLAATGIEYSKIFIQISLAGDTLVLDRFSLRSGNGTAEIKGKIILAGGTLDRFDLSLACRRFKLMETASMSGSLDADLRCQGSISDNDVTGSATLLNGYYRIPETTKKNVEEVQIIEAPGGTSAVVKEPKVGGHNIYTGMNMDAKLRIPGSFWLRGRGINAELKGNLEFRKSIDSGIRIAGTVQTVRGTYLFRQRTLNITDGTVTFSGSPRIDPFLNIHANAVISDVTIIIFVSGTLSKPEISLQSTPAMDQSDILSYLIFGRPTNKLSQAEGSVLQNTTANVISDFAIKGLRDVLGNDLTPDVIDVSPGGASGIGVGKYLNERLFVKYEWNIGPEKLSQTAVEYEINRFFNLRSQVGNEKTAGLDLLWRYDY